MKKILLLLCFVPMLMANTCEDDYYDDYPCTAEARAGINVTVSLNGDLYANFEGVSVTAREGNYISDLFQAMQSSPQFSGVYERAGTYIVTVSKDGYQTYISNPITVTRDPCHVIPRQLAINLMANP